MFEWFSKTAPIKSKFAVLVIVYGVLSSVGLLTTGLAVSGWIGSQPALLTGVAALGVVLTIGVTVAASRIICDPYVNTVERMEQLAAGDLTSEIDYTDHGDCVGRMAKAMFTFRDNAEIIKSSTANQEFIIENLQQGLRKLADRDLSHRIDKAFPPAYEALRADFNRATEALESAIGGVDACVSGINTGASEIRLASGDLSERTEQQAASLEETAAAMNQLTDAVRNTAEGAERADALVRSARDDAELGGTVVRRAVEAMDNISRSSNEIGDIISVIDGIAFQTNLLALNAGVEAARAGEAGRGFAVVASEVRALAQRSADSAKDIKTRISSSSREVTNGVELVGETGKALQRIIERVSEINGLVSEIAQSAQQQASGLQQINSAVSEMDRMTQQNAAMVEESTAAAQSLAGEADHLAMQVRQFKVRQTDAAAASPAVALQRRVEAQITRPAPRPAPRRAAARSNAAVALEEDWSTF